MAIICEDATWIGGLAVGTVSGLVIQTAATKALPALLAGMVVMRL